VEKYRGRGFERQEASLKRKETYEGGYDSLNQQLRSFTFGVIYHYHGF
jgi:hypothetical protein